MAQPIRILIADDHQMFIDGVRSSLENISHITIVGQAHNGEELLQLLSDKKCDIVLLDITMPKMNGMEACAEIKKRFPALQILVLSMHNEQEYIRKMMELGADGYVIKNIEPDELIRAIEKIHAGEHYFSSDVALAMMSPAPRIISEQMLLHSEILSKREVQIVKLIAQEMTSAQIANELFISESTVETHRRNIIQKLGVKSTVGIMKYAIQHGLV
ncbi:MAG TPA: response regulator transcription factor [Patescibacteria group bacterium]|nr:response regulator transcription factor [Patescibacteria group bacterium]